MTSDRAPLRLETPWPSIALSRDGAILSANVAFEACVGFQPSALEGKPFTDLVHEQDRDGAKELLQSGASIDLRFIAADGNERVFVIMPSGIGTDGSRVLSCCDITHHWQAKRRALESERVMRDEVRRYAEMIGAASDWFWETDAEGRFTYFSPNMEKRSGAEAIRILGKRRDEIGASNLGAQQWAEHLAVLQAHKPFRDFVRRVTLADGGSLWIKASGVPRFGPERQFTGYRGVASNVTAQVEAERAVAESEKRLRQLFEVASDWFWETDAEGRFTFLSSGWRDVTGQDPAQYLGRRREDFGDRTLDPEGWRRHLADLRARRPFREFSYCLVSRDGEKRWVKSSGIPIFDEEIGEFRGYRGVATDVTQIKVQDEALRRSEVEAKAARERAEESDRVKGDFLATMSHELRTPLNAIIGFSEIIEQARLGAISDKYREYTGDIRKAGQHLLAIINDILDVAKLQSGKADIHPEIVDVGSIIEEAMRIAAGQAEGRNLVLARCMGGKLPSIEADPIRLRQVLLNLLSNAIKFTPEGGRITVATRHGDGFVRIDISDTGIGMAEADIPKALEPFCQIKSSVGRKHKGTGLGLPLAKALAERHGGKLQISSTENVGTTVGVWFPLRCPPEME